jgi:hypothetical protein
MEKKSTVFTLDFANTRADQILRAHRRQHLLDCIEQAKKEKRTRERLEIAGVVLIALSIFVA